MIVRVAVQPPSLDDLGNWNHLDALDKSLDDVFWTRCGLYSLEGVESVWAGERLTGNRLRSLTLRQGAGAAENLVGWRVRDSELTAPVVGSGVLWFNPVHEGQGTGMAQSLDTLHCAYVGWISVVSGESGAAASVGQLVMERLQTLLLVETGRGEGRSGGVAYPWRIRRLFLSAVIARSTGRLSGGKKGHNWCEQPSAVGLWQRRA